MLALAPLLIALAAIDLSRALILNIVRGLLLIA